MRGFMLRSYFMGAFALLGLSVVGCGTDGLDDTALLERSDLARDAQQPLDAGDTREGAPEELDATDPKASWTNYTHYSGLDCVDVTRVKLVRRVYVSIFARSTGGGSWNALVNNYKLKNKQTISRCANGSQQLKVVVRTKKSSAYNIQFWD